MTTPRMAALEIARTLQQAGFEAFWVGGCVRDALLGRSPQDYDVATSARPEQVEALFNRTIPVGRQFGVILVVVAEISVQVATFRSEGGYIDGRHPTKVEYADARQDALRRDFTINGLFYDPLTDKVFDWVEGEKDLRAKILRTIGSPEERFAEDHLRLLRAVRFAAQLDFTVEEATWRALRARAATIRTVSAERVREELTKLFQPSHAGRGLRLLLDSGLLVEVLPELAATVGCEQSADHHPEGNVFEHIVLMLEKLPPESPPSLPWAVLLHDIAKPLTASKDHESGSIHFYGHEKLGAVMAEEILGRLKFPRRQSEEIVTAVLHHMQFKDVPKMRKATLRRMVMRPTFPLELELHRLDCLGSHGALDHHKMAKREFEGLGNQPELLPPLVTGEDLIALGLKPGPEVGRWLTQVRDLQLQEELRTREEALAWLKKRVGEGGSAGT